MKYLFAYTLVSIFLCGCDSPQDEITGVILPITNEHIASWLADTKGWMPTKAIIKKAEPVILTYIKDSDEEIFNKLDSYRCQYVGIINEGKKRIYCNFFWLTDEEKDWHTNPVFVVDGGNWYFQIEYDVDTEKCLSISVNGEA